MRILHAGKHYPPHRGGIETALRDLCDGLAQTSKVTAVVAHTLPRSVRESVNGVDVIQVASFGRIASVPICPTMPFVLWRASADCVVLHEPNPLAALALYLRCPARHLIIWHHGDILRPWWHPFVYRWLQAALYRRADQIIVSNPRLCDDSTILRPYRSRCAVIPYGVDLSRYALTEACEEQAAAIRKAYPAPLVLFVGRLVYYKGIDVLLDAMTRCPGTLLIVGDGPLKGRLTSHAKALGITSRVHFLSNVT